jgi:hypothetical protein
VDRLSYLRYFACQRRRESGGTMSRRQLVLSLRSAQCTRYPRWARLATWPAQAMLVREILAHGLGEL